MIDPKQFVNEVVRLATEYPNRTAECSYLEYTEDENCDRIPTGKPVCIMGTALFNLGVSVDALESCENDNMIAVNTKLDLGLPSPVVRWANDVQTNQDDGSNWCDAVADAQEVPSV
jgi:hypothetical protein